jgi:hypothetical protein
MKVNDVSLRAGPTWISEAFAMFREQPLPWIGLMLLWVLVTFVINVVPVIGGPIATILQTGFFAGFMLAGRDQRAGKAVDVSYLFAAFKQPSRGLVMVGCIALLAHTAVAMLVVALGFRTDSLLELMRLPQPELKTAIESGRFAAEINKLMPLTLLAQGLNLLITALLWFVAPMLAFNPTMPPTHAIRWSIYAFASNFGAMTLFVLLVAVMMMVATLPFALGLIVALPLFMISNYTSYRRVIAEN